MSIAYVRRTYNVPAARGRRVVADGRPGVITSAPDHRLRILLDGDKRPTIWHPTWRIDYLDGRGERAW